MAVTLSMESSSSSSRRLSSMCADGCPAYYVNDGYCDDVCNNAECGFDGADCAEEATPTPAPDGGQLCAAGCYSGWLGDGVCDDECYNAECIWDFADCEEATPTPAPDGGQLCAAGCYS